MTNLLVIFIVASVLNVVLNTVKSLFTINGGKWMAAFMNALTYGFYTYVIVLTVCDLPMLEKCLITAGCNFIGVWVVKFIQEKATKDKLWKIESSIDPKVKDSMIALLKQDNIPCNYIDIGKYVIVNCFCATQEESAKVKTILKCFNAKYFVSESKAL